LAVIDLASTFSGIAQAISAEFGGPYVAGRVIDQADDGFDDGGSIPDNPGDPTSRACMLQIDSVTEAMRQADGYAEGDVRFLILVTTLAGALDSDATVEVIDGPFAATWLVAVIERDPLNIYWQGRGRRAS
jgi:hypothetical protein